MEKDPISQDQEIDQISQDKIVQKFHTHQQSPALDLLVEPPKTEDDSEIYKQTSQDYEESKTEKFNEKDFLKLDCSDSVNTNKKIKTGKKVNNYNRKLVTNDNRPIKQLFENKPSNVFTEKNKNSTGYIEETSFVENIDIIGSKSMSNQIGSKKNSHEQIVAEIMSFEAMSPTSDINFPQMTSLTETHRLQRKKNPIDSKKFEADSKQSCNLFCF